MTAITTERGSESAKIESLVVHKKPFYLGTGLDEQLFLAAYASKLPVMLKGPTGCGKTRFVEYMAHQLDIPLITVSCHEDLFASDLVGRFFLKNEETIWSDGPLTQAVRIGAICYLDEIVEARKDTTVVIHPLTDNRRQLSIEKTREIIKAHPSFLLVVSYNPGYQSILKDLKQSTRQRFVSIDFQYLDSEREKDIVAHEGDTDRQLAGALVALGTKIRGIKDHGLCEGASTRLLIYAAQLIRKGIAPAIAARHAIALPITDDAKLLETLFDLIDDVF